MWCQRHLDHVACGRVAVPVVNVIEAPDDAALVVALIRTRLCGRLVRSLTRLAIRLGASVPEMDAFGHIA